MTISQVVIMIVNIVLGIAILTYGESKNIHGIVAGVICLVMVNIEFVISLFSNASKL